jgi:hypothetical protein
MRHASQRREMHRFRSPNNSNAICPMRGSGDLAGSRRDPVSSGEPYFSSIYAATMSPQDHNNSRIKNEDFRPVLACLRRQRARKSTLRSILDETSIRNFCRSRIVGTMVLWKDSAFATDTQARQRWLFRSESVVTTMVPAKERAFHAGPEACQTSVPW